VIAHVLAVGDWWQEGVVLLDHQAVSD
jgi:hypothetical protein